MGQSQLKKRSIYDEVIILLNNCNHHTLEYPTEEYSGITSTYISTIKKAYSDWKGISNKAIQLKLKLVEKWIVSFDKETEEGDVINLETKLIETKFPGYFKRNMTELLKKEAIDKGISRDEIDSFIKGNIIYYSIVQYCLERLYEIPDATEATVSQAIYFPNTNTYDAGYPIPFGKSNSLRKEDFKCIKASTKFRDFFVEHDFDFN